jgi:hypothetical protein
MDSPVIQDSQVSTLQWVLYLNSFLKLLLQYLSSTYPGIYAQLPSEVFEMRLIDVCILVVSFLSMTQARIFKYRTYAEITAVFTDLATRFPEYVQVCKHV